MVPRFPRTGTVMLKSDLRGIETTIEEIQAFLVNELKSDLRGIETLDATSLTCPA